MINHYILRCAQSKAAIASFIGDGKMWLEAHSAMKKACGYPLYRKPRTGGFIPPRMYMIGGQ